LQWVAAIDGAAKSRRMQRSGCHPRSRSRLALAEEYQVIS